MGFFDNPGVAKKLKYIESGEIGKDGFQRFFTQRLLATSSFENLLKRLIVLSPTDELRSAVQDNLNDEIGVFDGKIDPDKSHATWRRNFYQALEISDEMIAGALSGRGTEEYLQMMQEIIDGDNGYVMAGALLFLEGQIPREFRYLKVGRDLLFGEKFVDEVGDTEAVKAQKIKARTYLDDHIVHDAKAHFPQLLSALAAVGADADALLSICEGVELAKNARVAFYVNGDTLLD